jgi:hypothetical protein
MIATRTTPQAATARWGWGLLLAVSALLMLNGAAWYVFGPQRVAGDLEAFGSVDPSVVQFMAKTRQQVAIWYLSFGLLALLVALEGFWHGSRWAWNAMWVVVGATAAVGLLYAQGFGVFMLGAAALAVAGLVLARRGLAG